MEGLVLPLAAELFGWMKAWAMALAGSTRYGISLSEAFMKYTRKRTRGSAPQCTGNAGYGWQSQVLERALYPSQPLPTCQIGLQEQPSLDGDMWVADNSEHDQCSSGEYSLAYVRPSLVIATC